MAMIGAVLGGSAGSSQLVPAHLEVDPATQHVQLYVYLRISPNAALMISRVRESGQVILFDEIVGKGAVGTAMRSLPERLILKFGFPSPLLHEAAIYTQLAAWRGNLPVPRYLGVFPLDQQRVAILLSDVGSAIDVDDMTPAQRLSLAESIRRLHAAGVHHHDVFGNTVIDHEGNIRLVDLDKAEVVPPGTHCSNCDDEYCLSLLSKQ
ncbi:hypothetical protein C8R47DRAFT_752591 [Mycena vitilis]|nr:hypothetical protein C8R47DRAFT_752591 [Mycena vitilis]